MFNVTIGCGFVMMKCDVLVNVVSRRYNIFVGIYFM